MSITKNRTKLFFGIAGVMMAAMALSGCAQKVRSNAALDEAKAAYQAAQANPTVMRSAALELKKAEEALTKAEETFQEKGELAVVEHQAYISKQHSAIAQEIANQKIAEDAIAQASAERNKVLLEARDAEISLAQQQTEAQRAAAEKAMGDVTTAQERAAKLEQEIAELQAVKADRGLVMTLGEVVFDVNKADLKPGGIATVDKLAAFMKEYPNRRVMIEGFTDSTGTPEYNKGLSERRALAVRNALLDKGVESNRVDIHGYGIEFPVATNATAAGRQMNRRVEIIISDEAGVIPARTK